MVNEIVKVNNRKYQEAYAAVFSERLDALSAKSLDFLYQCDPYAAYDFLQFCLNYRKDVFIRLTLCEFIMYGDIVIEDGHSIIRDVIHSILSEDSYYLPALEFVIYNYCEHPECPFSTNEMLSFAQTILRFCNDKVALKITKIYKEN